MDHDHDGETSYNTFVDDVAFEPTYLQALLTAAGRNVATYTLFSCTPLRYVRNVASARGVKIG